MEGLPADDGLHLDSLESLNLHDNMITSLDDISHLSSFPKLKTLSLGSNPMVGLSIDQSLHFTSVTSLDLSATNLPVTSFAHLPQLFPSLTSFRFTTTSDDDSLLTIARIGTLIMLNYGTITPQARTNAELFYLSRITKQLSSTSPDDEQSILTEHPRYAELCGLHGEPNIVREPPKPRIDPDSLAARIARFSFRLAPSFLAKYKGIRDLSMDENAMWAKSIDLPRTLQLYHFYGVIGNALDVSPWYIHLIWETGEWDPIRRKKFVGLGEGLMDTTGSSGTAGPDEDNTGRRSEVQDLRVEGAWNPEDVEEREAREADQKSERPGWVKREVVLVQSTREVGYFVEGSEAILRVEWANFGSFLKN